jgi:hypothetical protein
MYAICERHGTVGSVVSRDNCCYWLDGRGKTTPCSDMAAVYETLEEAEAAAAEAGITLGEGSWWTVVDMDEDE